MKRIHGVAAAIVLISVAAVVVAFVGGDDDWQQHLGPAQDNTSKEAGLLDTWPKDGPPELWRHKVGIGFAGPAIVDGKVFLNDRIASESDVLRVFDLDSGKELWSYKYPAPGRVNFAGSRSTPCVTDTHVFTTGGFGHIHAINRKTRKPDWAYNIYDKYPDTNKRFGYGLSPMLVDDHLLISPTTDKAPIVVAVDPKTGKTLWESDARLNTMHTFHTPVIRTIAGTRGISCRDRTHVYFIDIKTGKTLWSEKVFSERGGPHVTIPPVTVFGDNNRFVFVTNGYENGSVLLEVQPKDGGGFNVIERYDIDQGGQVHPAIYLDKHLYLNINENANLRRRNPTGGLACIDAATGKIKWKTKADPNLNRGATTLVDGKLLAFDGDTGELLLIKPDPSEFKLISKFVAIKPMRSSNNAWSPIVVSEGRLVIRDHQEVVCFDLRDKSKQKAEASE